MKISGEIIKIEDDGIYLKPDFEEYTIFIYVDSAELEILKEKENVEVEIEIKEIYLATKIKKNKLPNLVNEHTM